jgi:hypothetical protein
MKRLGWGIPSGALAFFVLFSVACASGAKKADHSLDHKPSSAPEVQEKLKDALSSSHPSAAAHDELIWISRPDGALSCGEGNVQSVEDGAAELRKAGVKVLESRKTNDGKIHIQMCGAATGSQNSYRIPTADWSKADKLGFRRDPGPKLR